MAMAISDKKISEILTRPPQKIGLDVCITKDGMTTKVIPNNSRKPNYKFREDEIIQAAFDYINSTYVEHYADEKTGIQTMDFIMSNSESFDFLKGNVLKYVARYGKKDGLNKKDIYKAIHYLILLHHFSQDNK